MKASEQGLSPLDDYPVHQIAEPIRHVATSDRNFYDRYYFNCHSDDGAVFLGFGLGQYANLDVADGFAAVAADGRHRVVRASRRLGADRMDTSVGPLRVEVIEGLSRLRVVCEPDQAAAGDPDGVAFDLTWTGSAPPVREPRHFGRDEGRVVVDSVRMAQTGRWSGTLTLGGRELAVSPDRWWGFRDRSWGVRPVGEPEPKGVRENRQFGTFYWVYVPAQFEKFSVLVVIQEDESGWRRLENAVRVPADGGDPVPLGPPRQSLEIEPDTRAVLGATLDFTPRHEPPSRLVVRPMLPLYLAVGTGYGLEADWRHGMYRGPLWTDRLAMDAAEAAGRGRYGVVEQAAACEYRSGETVVHGFGMLETALIGPHAPSGLS